MKRNILISIIVLALFSTFLSCKKEKVKEENLDKQEKREIVAAIFGAAMDGYNIGVADAKNTKSIAPFDTNISYNFSFVKTDGEDGYISIEVEGTGIYHYDDNNVFNCLGGIIRLNVAETINHYKVVLSNGRVCYIDADPAINIVMNLDLLPGCVTFDPTTSYVKIVGTFQCEGYSYDISINVKIKEDGTPSLMQGTINGASIYF